MARILLVDDDPDLGENLQESLREQGHDVQWHDLPKEALDVLSSGESFDVILLDNMMPTMSGIEVLTKIKERGIHTEVILFTGASGDQTAIEAMKQGAFDYIVKPFSYDDLIKALAPSLQKALEVASRPRQVAVPTPSRLIENDQSSIVGCSNAMLEVFKQIGRYAKPDCDDPVLIWGETGTGKELVAQAIHTNSERKTRPFVVVPCTGVEEASLEQDLFGHELGAFAGADKLRKGRFEHAQGGTLFLKELGDVPLRLQNKLLRVLEKQQIERLGSSEPIKIDVRVLAATHRDPAALVQDQKLRKNLSYHLEGYMIHLPPLRDRKEDIELLVEHFLRSAMKGDIKDLLHPDALHLLREHPWEGNVRELEHVVRRAVSSCHGSQILPRDIHFSRTSATAVDSSAGQPVSIPSPGTAHDRHPAPPADPLASQPTSRTTMRQEVKPLPIDTDGAASLENTRELQPPSGLLDRLRRPDSGEAWKRFIALYTPVLQRWADHLLPQPAEADDLVQEVFVTLMKNLPRFSDKPQHSFRAWLQGFARGVWLGRCQQDIPTTVDPLPVLPDEDFWEREYRTEVVQRAVQMLMQRPDFEPATIEAALATFRDGQLIQGIACQTGLTSAAVCAARSRVLRRLREDLAGLLD